VIRSRSNNSRVGLPHEWWAREPEVVPEKAPTMARRVYSLQFKDEACKLAASQDYNPGRAAEQLGVDPTTLRSWMKQRKLLAEPQSVVDLPLSDDVNVLRIQLKEARQRIRRLETEKEILKKATAFFAKENP
jgi:transposase